MEDSSHHAPTSFIGRLNSTLNSSTTRGVLNTTLHSSQSLTGRSSIMTYRNTQYPSASAALDAYIDDFENQNPSMSYHRTVEDLLSPRSLLQLTVQRSLETGVRDTEDETRRYNMKKMLDESYQQIMRADTEMQKARELVKSSKLLSQSASDPYLSPLPGSSNITDQLSDITMSTDAMVHTPAYLERHREPVKSESSSHHHHGYRVLKERNQGTEPNKLGLSQDAPKLGFSKHNEVTGTLSYGRENSRQLYDSTEAIINYKLRSPSASHKITFDKSVSSIHQPSLGDSDPIEHFSGTGISNAILSTPYGTETTNESSSIGRQPPSWIEEFEVSNRPTPSWIDDLDTSGRPPPSWIQEVNESKVAVGNLSRPQKLSAHTGSKHVERTLLTNRPGNMRNLSTASELLMSATQKPYLKSHDGSRDLRITDLDDVSTSSSEETYKFTRNLRRMFREQNQRAAKRNVSQRISNQTSFKPSDNECTRYSQQNQRNDKNSASYRTSNHPSFKPSTYELKTHNLESARLKRSVPTVNDKKDPSRDESFTTDDLLKVSPTGRDFNVITSTNDDHKSHRYSKNRSPKVARKIDSDSGRLVRSQERTKRIVADTKDSIISTNTDSLIYTPPRGDVIGAKRQHDGKLGRIHGRMDYQNQGKVSRDAPHLSRDDRIKERARRILSDKTETPRTRLQSSPSGDSISVMPSLRTSPIAVGVGVDHARCFLTEEILEGDRSWEKNLPSIKPPQPVDDKEPNAGAAPNKTNGVLDQFLDDCLVTSKQESPRLTNGRQPGPVEALKNILFTLQQITPDQQTPEEQKEQRMDVSGTEIKPSHTSPRLIASSPQLPQVKTSSILSSSTSTITTTDFDEAPGGKSLQRAMHHLSRLKSLVYDTSNTSTMEDDQSSKPSSYKDLPLTSR